MKVKLASCAGACYGVQRALDMAHGAAHSGKRVQTLGSLIHNPQVVSELAAEGVGKAGSVDEACCDALIIRSHGVPPAVLESVRARGLEIIDATCPHVLRAQKAVAQLAHAGCTVVLVGEYRHPEVEGLRAQADISGTRVVVVMSPDDLPDDLTDPIGVVVQTTQSTALFDRVVQELQQRGLHPDVRNTICQATAQRQEAAERLAREVDAMVVIGGHDSSNTTRLYEICAPLVRYAVHVESPDELDEAAFADFALVGVTAGASTPDNQIQAIVSTIEGW